MQRRQGIKMNIGRLIKKNIGMKIEIVPNTLSVHADQLVKENEEIKIRVRIVRGPLTWTSPTIYTINSETTQVTFNQQESFEKESGFYFSGMEPEFKKAVIEILRVENEQDEEGLPLQDATINLSSLISFETHHEKLQIGDKGFKEIEFSGRVYPADPKDKEFIDKYIEES